jgi:hypothetical protein
MPFYEVVLRYPDRDELRLTDEPLVPGETVDIAGDRWSVVLERDPVDVRATARFLCELTVSQRERAKRMRAFNREIQERLAKLQGRMERPED